MDDSVRALLKNLPFIALGVALWVAYYVVQGQGWWSTALFWVALVYWVGVLITFWRTTRRYS